MEIIIGKTSDWDLEYVYVRFLNKRRDCDLKCNIKH